MCRYAIFFFLFLIQNVYSQSYKAIYNFSYKIDSLKSEIQDIDMVLDLQKEYTKFYYKKLIKLDSLVRNNAIISYSFPIQQVVKRKKNSFENSNFVSVGDKYYNYSSVDEMKWKILAETKFSNSYKLQKAETRWGGRKWTAWFALDVAISEGPYKFRGLPGLIFELTDTKDNFKYTLISFTKVLSEYNTSNIVESNLGVNSIKITLKEYQNLLLDNYNNPFSEYQNMKEGSWGLNIFGKDITTHEGLKNVKKEYQHGIISSYNPIELDKAIKYK